MMTKRVVCDLNDAYRMILADVWLNAEAHPSPVSNASKGATRERFNYEIVVTNPRPDPVVTRSPKRNATIASYTQRELALYLSGTNRVADFAAAAKYWQRMALPDGTVNSAYGHLIWKKESCGEQPRMIGLVTTNEPFQKVVQDNPTSTPWEWVAGVLERDRDSRQGVLMFLLPEHLWEGCPDVVCTLHAHFMIRGDRLNMSVVMRSQDIVYGWPYDAVFFAKLQHMMRDELVERKYPELQVGSYTHYVHSLHAYVKDEALINEMLYGPAQSDTPETPVTHKPVWNAIA